MVVYKSVKTPTAVAEWLIHTRQEQADRLSELYVRLQRVTQHAILRQQNKLDYLLQSLRFATQKRLQQQQSKLEVWNKTISLHSPERIYRMGYSLTTCHGQVVKSIHDVQKGEVLQTHMADGVITSIVEE